MATVNKGILRQGNKTLAFTAEAIAELQKGSKAITSKDVGLQYDPATITGVTASSCRRPPVRPGTRR